MGPSPMRTVTYIRHAPFAEPEIRSAELAVFVYDIPYVGACGIFPPYPLINRLFESGGAEGGMGPGATWPPFFLNETEYDDLVAAIERLDLTSLQEKARFGRVAFSFDKELETETDWDTWAQKACDRHRKAWYQKLQHAQAGSKGGADGP
ncbi:hypothetical protein MSL71_38590 [Desulfoluna butyratoxydans]|uniref:Uncharacterized protein n=2 Tax=Desulfoluna butyratoxydans TaxID=231438 RepID=A0A4U8YPQ0_9BACT|nr:hypothetical protein MSL71_38590 [Desulfoluna butyratoxydans]